MATPAYSAFGVSAATGARVRADLVLLFIHWDESVLPCTVSWKTNAISVITASGKQVVIHTVITDGQALWDTLSGFQQLGACETTVKLGVLQIPTSPRAHRNAVPPGRCKRWHCRQIPRSRDCSVTCGGGFDRRLQPWHGAIAPRYPMKSAADRPPDSSNNDRTGGRSQEYQGVAAGGVSSTERPKIAIPPAVTATSVLPFQSMLSSESVDSITAALPNSATRTHCLSRRS